MITSAFWSPVSLSWSGNRMASSGVLIMLVGEEKAARIDIRYPKGDLLCVDHENFR